jgi:hypothetical protein
MDLVDGDANARQELLDDKFDVTDVGDLTDLEEIAGRSMPGSQFHG